MRHNLKPVDVPLILIVPCFNEANRLERDVWLSNASRFDQILFVDDGSTDNTLKVLEELLSQAKEQNITNLQILVLKTNQGKAGAIRAGVLHSCKDLSSGSYIGYCDADLSTPLDEMQRLADTCKTDNIDFLLGSRIKLAGFNVERSGARHYLGRASATLICTLLNITVYDTQAGAKVFQAKFAETLFKNSFVSPWLFDCELILRAKHADISVREEPLKTWVHQDNDSKVNLVTYIKSLFDLLKIRKKYMTGE